MFANLFTSFAFWDDEGYFLQAFREFLSGRVLFDQVFSLYGPLTFFLAALFAGFDAANVTHDSLRWITFPAWLLIAALLAGVVWRWTHRLAPSVVVFLMAGPRLTGLALGIGHPQMWILVALAILVSIGPDQMLATRGRALWAGVITGAIFLLKINVGILVFLGLALALSLHLKPRPKSWICSLLAAVACAVGALLFLSGSAASEKLLALAYVGSLAVTAGTAYARPVESPLSLRSLVWIATGLAACVGLGIITTLALGTSPRAFYDVYVTLPALMVQSYHNPFTDATGAGGLTILLMALALTAAVFWKRRRTGLVGLPLGLIKMAVGLGLLLAFCYDHRMTLVGSLLVQWLLIMPTTGNAPASESAYANRLLLALLAPLFSLQLFPMAGSQVDWAVLLPITAAGVLLSDGMNAVEGQVEPARLPRILGKAMVTLLTLLTLFMFYSVGSESFDRVSRWRDQQPLSLPGAHWIRLNPLETAHIRSTVAAIKENCQSVLTVPGLYSYTIWSGVAPFESKRINGWPFLWPANVQTKELPALRDQPRGCALVSQDVYGFFKGFANNPGDDELPAEIERTMDKIYQRQDTVLYRSPLGIE